MRLRQHGYRIIQVNAAVLEHAWGNMREVRLPGKTVMHLNYPPFRWYYITRNFLYVFARYRTAFPETYALHRRFVVKQALLALVFEPHRRQRLRLMIKGLGDYRAGKLGKLEWPSLPHVAARDRHP